MGKFQPRRASALFTEPKYTPPYPVTRRSPTGRAEANRHFLIACPHVNNNPARFNDPTGHMVDEQGCSMQGCDISEGEEYYDFVHNVVNRKAQVKERADKWAWNHIPSAIGVDIGVSGQIGAGVEPGTFFEIGAVYNWRSGEFDALYSTGPQIFIGTPNVLEGGVYVSFTTYKGLSQNDYLEGGSVFSGGVVSGGAFGKISLSKYHGISILPGPEVPPSFFIDGDSKMPVTYDSVAIGVGINACANGVDAGVIGGFNGTTIITKNAFIQ